MAAWVSPRMEMIQDANNSDPWELRLQSCQAWVVGETLCCTKMSSEAVNGSAPVSDCERDRRFGKV